MKNNLGILLIFVLFFSSNLACASELNIASFNLRLAPTPTSNDWNKRSDSVKRLVRYHDFDIFGIQEGFLHQADDIKADDGVYEYVADPRDDGKEKGETCAIFYKPSKFELILNGRFWFSDTPNKPSLGWDAMCKRVCTWAKFRDKKDGKIFFVFSLHFDHKGMNARMNSAKLLVQKVKSIAKKNPFFIVGDFNTSPQSAPILYLLANGYKDAKISSKTQPYGPEETFHNFTGAPIAGAQERIDFIFTSPSIEIERFGVLSDRLCELIKEEIKFGGNKSENTSWSSVRTPSDHYPIVAKAVLK